MRVSKGAQQRAARAKAGYRETRIRPRELVVPVMETKPMKVGCVTFPVRLPKVELNAHGVLEGVVNRFRYKTATLVRA